MLPYIVFFFRDRSLKNNYNRNPTKARYTTVDHLFFYVTLSHLSIYPSIVVTGILYFKMLNEEIVKIYTKTRPLHDTYTRSSALSFVRSCYAIYTDPSDKRNRKILSETKGGQSN